MLFVTFREEDNKEYELMSFKGKGNFETVHFKVCVFVLFARRRQTLWNSLNQKHGDLYHKYLECKDFVGFYVYNSCIYK